MLPSSTVENYLKAIYHGVGSLSHGERLLPMGHLAAALGVAPGTATTMVKTLAESGLVEYEPYTGVALTAAGEKLAALVLRRHRLIELFLVQVMGLSWDEVHDDAEQLEHVVSERLIDRMDQMLGRPEVDPHGDPIPDPSGTVKPQDVQSLLTCPLNRRVTVTRVIDQDKAFLRFIESHHLKPGESIEVEERDAASDSVRVKGKDDHRVTIGTRAASKLLVQLAGVVTLMLVLGSVVRGQTSTSTSNDSHRPFESLDNSFLVEEAFNQEKGVFQNIFNVIINRSGDWVATFTQEWPVFGNTHQFSYSVPYFEVNRVSGFGDVLLNYRLQVMTEDTQRPAFAPRLSVILPSGSWRDQLGNGHLGWQVNLPFSKQAGDVYFHWNAGFTHTPKAVVENVEYNLIAPQVAISGIWRMKPMLNLMLESVGVWPQTVQNAGTPDSSKRRDSVVTVSPGLRTGWNHGNAQTIIGFAMPVTIINGNTSAGVIGYFSYELPFVKQP
jgi:DtxR family transcriptional regulator, Mn-dependent transcriptional regulator